MDNGLRVTIGGSAFSENASPARTDANRRKRKLRLPRGIRRSQAASGDQLTERVEDNAFHLTAVSDKRLQQAARRELAYSCASSPCMGTPRNLRTSPSPG
jgi:hypothetical protein